MAEKYPLYDTLTAIPEQSPINRMALNLAASIAADVEKIAEERALVLSQEARERADDLGRRIDGIVESQMRTAASLSLVQPLLSALNAIGVSSESAAVLKALQAAVVLVDFISDGSVTKPAEYLTARGWLDVNAVSWRDPQTGGVSVVGIAVRVQVDRDLKPFLNIPMK